jgi:hypothetical protein
MVTLLAVTPGVAVVALALEASPTPQLSIPSMSVLADTSLTAR